MAGRELEVDQHGAAVRRDDDVLLLVKVVVTDARRVQCVHVGFEPLEEVPRQNLSAMEREPLGKAANEDRAAIWNAAVPRRERAHPFDEVLIDR